MLWTPQYTKDQRVFLVNRKTRGDSYRVINYDFKKAFPLAGRDPTNMTFSIQKRKFAHEGFYTDVTKDYFNDDL
jgi:hypothetical protein